MTYLNAREKLVLRKIARAAREGKPCPTNIELSNDLQSGSSSTGGDVVRALEAKGLIEVTRGHNWRIVTVIETGHRTVHPEMEAKRDPRRSPNTIYIRPKGPVPEPVSRDACFMCGTRMDLASPRCSRPHAEAVAA